MRRLQLGALAWVLAPVIIMLAFYGAIVGSISLVQKITGGIDPNVFFYIPFLSILPPLVLLLIWYVQRSRDDASELVITSEGTLGRDVAVGVVLWVACVVTFVGSLKLLGMLGVPAANLSSLSWMHHLFFATVGAIVPGVAEEIYFRGFLMQRLRNVRAALAILITSLSFASWHILSPPYLLHTFLIGAILGSVYYHTQRLLPVMIGHTLANATAGVLVMTGYI